MSLLVDRSKIVQSALASWFESGAELPITDSCTLHAFEHTVEVGGESYVATIRGFRTGFPDVHWRTRRMLTDGDWATAHVDLVGTHLGPWQDFEPTGRRIEWEHMLLFRFEAERIAEVWEVFDPEQIATQLTGPRGAPSA